MRSFEHQVIEAHGYLKAVMDQIGPEWLFCGAEPSAGTTLWVFAKEIPAPSPSAMLMEISQQLEALASEVEMDTTMMRLSRLASCVAAIAQGETVTVEDITGKPSS